VAVAWEGAAGGSVTRDQQAAKQDVVLRRGFLFVQAAMKSTAGHTVEEDNGREQASRVDVATFFEHGGLSLGVRTRTSSWTFLLQDKQEAMIEFLHHVRPTF